MPKWREKLICVVAVILSLIFMGIRIAAFIKFMTL